ncbi:MAG: glutathione S-transferase family protein [Burkholderiaceae bacterium]
MTLKIYGIAASRAIRTLWMAHELGLPYDHQQIHYQRLLQDDPDYGSVNPNLRIPTIDDDGFVLWESLAINAYLAKKYADKGLAPSGLQEEAKLMQWSLWAVTEVEPWNNQWGFHTMALPEPERKPALAAEALQKLDRPLKVLDAHLAAHPHVLGARFTVADMNVAGCLYRGLWMPLDGYPHANRWLHACWTRPAALVARKMREG